MICIGIDQSYTDTGIAISKDGIPIKWISENFKKCKNKPEKRIRLKTRLESLYSTINDKYSNEEILVIVERIRTFTKGKDLRPNYLKSTGALIATIVDESYKQGHKVYSVDTRSWMSRVIGKGNKKKIEKPSIDFVKTKFGIDVKYITKTGLTKYNDNISDAICISQYGFCEGVIKLLKLEE